MSEAEEDDGESKDPTRKFFYLLAASAHVESQH